ncbi:MAG: DNA-processing protein DprA [Nocardioidaceae bacterium]
MSSLEDERLARVALNRLGEPGDLRMSGLVAAVGGVAVRDQLLESRALPGLQDDVAARMAAIDPARDLERAARRGIRFVIPGDDEWPAQLDDLATVRLEGLGGGAPVGLWVRGPARLDALARSVAIVGSRSSTTYGEDIALEMGARLAQEGFWVVSGAAFGIDHAAHRGALAAPAGSAGTVAVLACGVDRAYPLSHRPLLDGIAECGAVVSEAPVGAAPTRWRFLVRNRLIAALARGTVLVEAALRSGALNTAGWAEALNRQVMGVPGPVTSEPSAGVHELLRTGSGTLVTRTEDVLELVGASGEHLVEVRRGPTRRRDRLSPRQRQVLDAVPLVVPAGRDSIARAAGIAAADVGVALDEMARLGLVEEVSTGWRLTPRAQE